MSVSKFIICERCKKSLWIGQGSIIYTGMPEVMEALRDFCYSHKSTSDNLFEEHSGDHPLKFVDEYYMDYLPWKAEEGWEEIDADTYKKPSPDAIQTTEDDGRTLKVFLSEKDTEKGKGRNDAK